MKFSRKDDLQSGMYVLSLSLSINHNLTTYGLCLNLQSSNAKVEQTATNQLSANAVFTANAMTANTVVSKPKTKASESNTNLSSPRKEEQQRVHNEGLHNVHLAVPHKLDSDENLPILARDEEVIQRGRFKIRNVSPEFPCLIPIVIVSRTRLPRARA